MKVDKMGRLMPFNIIMRKHSCNIMIITSPSLWIQCDKWMFPHFLLMDLIGWLVTLQRTWRLMWRASCLTVWTLKDWALHTQRQTTVTPAWTKLGYDGSKTCGHSLNVARWRGRGENIPKNKQANWGGGRMDSSVTVQLNTFLHLFLQETLLTFSFLKSVKPEPKR